MIQRARAARRADSSSSSAIGKSRGQPVDAAQAPGRGRLAGLMNIAAPEHMHRPRLARRHVAVVGQKVARAGEHQGLAAASAASSAFSHAARLGIARLGRLDLGLESSPQPIDAPGRGRSRARPCRPRQIPLADA